MNKKRIRLTESDFHKIVKESVNKILKESSYDSRGASLSDEFIEETTQGFKRQVANLIKYMNAYSTTLRDFLLGEEEFGNLYDSLAKIHDNYCLG
jgi:hypothetical protein